MRRLKKIPLYLATIVILIAILLSTPSLMLAYKATDFHWRPPFTMSSEDPSITLLIDSSASTHRMSYAKMSEKSSETNLYEKSYGADYDSSKNYTGYFDHTKRYTYNDTDSSFEYFEIPTGGAGSLPLNATWSGNFLNWATMHRIDSEKQILTGGVYETRSGDKDNVYYTIIKTNINRRVAHNATNTFTVPYNYTNNNTAPTLYFMQEPNTINWVILQKIKNSGNEDANYEAYTSKVFKLRIKGNLPNPKDVIIDQFAGKARFAVARFYIEDADNNGVDDSPNADKNGAKIIVDMMDTNSTNSANLLKKKINEIHPNGGAPLAEALFTTVGYLQQVSSSNTGPRWKSDSYKLDPNNDPYWVWCTQQNIIFITPGESTFGDAVPVTSADSHITPLIPSTFPRIGRYLIPDDTKKLTEMDSAKKYYALDVAHWMHTTDIRSTRYANTLQGTQKVNLFIVQAFGKGDKLLVDTAKFGGFTDLNGDNTPYNNATWQLNEFFTGVTNETNPDIIPPDNYFAGETSDELRTAISNAFEAALRRVTSATAAAVTSQTRSGEGAAYQALFFPPTTDKKTQLAADWSGQVHALFVDNKGEMREDSNHNLYIDNGDSVIRFQGEEIRRYNNSTAETYESVNNTNLINFLWSSTTWLNSTSPSITSQRNYNSTGYQRHIFTFADIDDTGIPKSDEYIQNFDNNTCDNLSDLSDSGNFCSYLTLIDETSETLQTPSSISGYWLNQAQRQINFIRGEEIPSTYKFNSIEYNEPVRSRTHKGTTWRLGDIVYSSPTIVSSPAENYHLLYKDNTYRDFYNQYKSRRHVIYTGANDGMLHAFNAGFHFSNSTTSGFKKFLSNEPPHELGAELWAYIPNNLLPHLKWLMNPSYGGELHVPYMDLKPRVFDARVFLKSDGSPLDSTIYPHGWGTILVAGMRFGGGKIQVDVSKNGTDIRTLSSAYVILDITNPEKRPRVLGEIKFNNLGFTTCYPTVMPMTTANAITTSSNSTNEWYLVFGSGPANSTGEAQAFPKNSLKDKRDPATSDQAGHLFVLDLKTLIQGKKIETIDSTGIFTETNHSAFSITSEQDSFIGDPIAVDLDIGSSDKDKAFKTDIIYYGTTSGSEESPKGKLRRILTSNIGRTGVNSEKVNWQKNTLIDVSQPITSAPSVTVDDRNQLWVFFGTGRFYNRGDIPQNYTMSFYGVKEPHNATDPYSSTVTTSSLYDSNKISVYPSNRCTNFLSADCVDVYHSDNPTSLLSWDSLTSSIENNYNGWKLDFTEPYERVLGQAAILGGAVLFTSYIPDTDICIPEGISRLYGLYYKTGTAFYKPILGLDSGQIAKFVGLKEGLAITPTLHVGDRGVTAFIQSSTGAIETYEIVTPISVKSGPLFWRKNTN